MNHPYVTQLLQNTNEIVILEFYFQEYLRSYLELFPKSASLQATSNSSVQFQPVLMSELESLAKQLTREMKELANINIDKLNKLIEVIITNDSNESYADSSAFAQLAMDLFCFSFECKKYKFISAFMKALKQVQAS